MPNNGGVMTMNERSDELEYAIDPEILKRPGRDFSFIMWEYLCTAARVALDGDRNQLSTMSFLKIRQLVIRSCANDGEYISPQFPVKEIVFRLLMIAPGTWVPERLLHVALSDLLITSPWPRPIDQGSLRRILSRAQIDGIISRPSP